MRMKRSRLNYFLPEEQSIPQKIMKAVLLKHGRMELLSVGEQWPASGKVQAQQYGDRLGYILNMKVNGYS